KVGGERRAVLVDVFNRAILSRDSNALLAYYGSLSSYGELVQRVNKTKESLDEVFTANMNELENMKNGVSGIVDEEAKLVQSSLLGVEEDFGALSSSMLDFISEYDENVEVEHAATLEELA